MKKLLAGLLTLLIALSCCGCGKNKDEKNDGTGQGNSVEEAAQAASAYAQLFLNGKFTEAEDYVFFTSDQVLSKGARLYPHSLIYEENRVVIDGESFNSVAETIAAAQERMGVEMALEKLEQREIKSTNVDVFMDLINDDKLAVEIFKDVDEKTLKTMTTVEYDVSIKISNQQLTGTLTVYLMEQNGSWKVVSPTWISLILSGYPIVK